jgi:hypothetical protein
MAQLTYIVQPTLRPKVSMGVHGKGFFTDALLCVRWRALEGGAVKYTHQSLLIGAGIEHNYRFRKDFRLVPKLVTEYNFGKKGLMLRLQNRFYPAKDMDYRRLSWQVCPEIGAHFSHAFTIGYGYSFAITNASCTPSLGHQVCLGFNYILKD